MIILTGRPISKKRNYRRGGHGGLYLSKTFRKWEEQALKQIKRRTTITGEVDVSYTFHIKGRLNADLDNLCASINDLLQKAGVIENDKQIVSMTATKIYGSREWLTEVEVTKL